MTKENLGKTPSPISFKYKKVKGVTFFLMKSLIGISNDYCSNCCYNHDVRRMCS